MGQEIMEEIHPLYLIASYYDGKSKGAMLKFYDATDHRIVRMPDNTNHKPYCYTNLSVEELDTIPRIAKHPSLIHYVSTFKINSFTREKSKVTKIVTTDPLSIGGDDSNAMSNILSGVSGAKSWEDHIPYNQCYLYDRLLMMGFPYFLMDDKLFPYGEGDAEKRIQIIMKLFSDLPKEEYQAMKKWIELLEYPAPTFKRIAVDIEVQSSSPDHVPDVTKAEYPIIAVAVISTDGKKRILLLKRGDIANIEKIKEIDITYFRNEPDLILELFKLINEYPIIVTFNGDAFDITYIYHRAINLGIPREQIPIIVGKDKTTFENTIHIDLYKFFEHNSIQNYVFRRKYLNFGLDDIARGLLNKGKLETTKDFLEITDEELIDYCLRDGELTHELTTFDDELVMKLMIVLMRISDLPLEDVTRFRISRWILSMMYLEHRRRNILIPSREELLARGEIQTKAVIKGKKYRGAIVIDAPTGVFFNVKVVDFASLYPTVIKERNLGYETINCTDSEECKTNIVPETSHWVCKNRQSLTSLLIGTLRDARVKWYKKQTKAKDISKEMRSWYTCIQEGIKVFLNASYGVFGNESFALYCPPVSESTTAYSRHAILSTIDEAKNLGINVIYGDTDSLFLDAPTNESLEKLVDWCDLTLKLELEIDKVYKFVVFAARKKNYLGVLMDGTLDIKGLTGKKKHIPMILKNGFDYIKEELKDVEGVDDFTRLKKETISTVQSIYKQFKYRNWNLDDLAFHVVLGKSLFQYVKTTPQHVKAAKFMEELSGVEVRKGDIIHYIKVKPKKKGDTNAKPVKSVIDDEVDIDKYIELLETTFAPIMEPLGLDFKSDILGETTLDKFFVS